MIEHKIMIINTKGMHARASAKFVETVEAFDAKCEVTKDGITVSGDSIMGLLMLAASKGSFITLKTWGNSAQLLVDALVVLIENNFEEDY